jgi:Tfp pilus assembly protein PilE
MQRFRFLIIGLIILNPAIAIPAIAAKITKPLPSEAETATATIMRYQTAFFFEHDRFGETLKETMGKEATKGSKTYSYQIVPHPELKTITMVTAVPKKKGLPTLIALISGTQKNEKTNQSQKSGVNMVSSILCEGTKAGTTMPSWTSIIKPNNTSELSAGLDCPEGFKEIR